MDLLALRHDLHRHPELSGAESGTAGRVAAALASLGPDQLVRDLGGHGLAAVFEGRAPGPSVLLRCELDALPIDSPLDAPHHSLCPGVSHQCGHDGHMAILVGVAAALARQRPARGRVVLLFQPAEETGAGAAAVLADPRFAALQPDLAFALHNLPGEPLGQVLVRAGAQCAASRGLSLGLVGRPAHAAHPETGLSPARALCRLVDELPRLPARVASAGELALATVVGARLGERAFGTAPERGEVWVTLRCERDETMARLVAAAGALAEQLADEDGLTLTRDESDVFAATVNDPRAVALLAQSTGELTLRTPAEPFRWSEDFGLFTARCPGALFGLGAGLDTPGLHHRDYDFPDALQPVATALFLRLIECCQQGLPPAAD